MPASGANGARTVESRRWRANGIYCVRASARASHPIRSEPFRYRRAQAAQVEEFQKFFETEEEMPVVAVTGLNRLTPSSAGHDPHSRGQFRRWSKTHHATPMDP